MTIFIAVVLSVLSLFFIAYPFFNQKRNLSASNAGGRLRNLSSGQDNTNSILKDLEADFQSGLLTEEDYHDLESRYKLNAASNPKGVSIPDKGMEGDIETQIQQLRQVKSKNVGKDVEEEVLKLRKTQGRFCPECGTKNEIDDRFCARCGTKLK